MGLLVVFRSGQCGSNRDLAGVRLADGQTGPDAGAAAPLATAAVCLGSFLSGLLMAILQRAKGLVWGAAEGVLFAGLLFILVHCYQVSETMQFVRAGLVLLMGVLGGVLGMLRTGGGAECSVHATAAIHNKSGGKSTMWVYQETETNAAALVPTLPEDTAGESLAEKGAMTPASGRLTEMSPQKAPRRKPFQASRDCILLAAAYLFGTLMAGVLQALCDAEEMETLAYYLDCWRGVFAASSTAQAVGLFGAELAVVLGAAAVFLLLGLSAVGPLPIFLFAMLYGTGSGLLSAQLLNSLGAKQLVLFLLTASLPTALAAGALCLFGASALQVSSRIHAFSFGRGDKGSRPAGARLLVGQFALLAVCLCPLCGAATGLVCLANRLMQAG